MDYAKISAEYGVDVETVRMRHTILFRARWKSDFKLFCKHRVKIRNKIGEIVPFEVNEAQKVILDRAEKQLASKQWVRINVLKGRRQGVSTLVSARGYYYNTLWGGYNTYIQAHVEDSSKILFNMVKTIWKYDSFRESTSVDNSKSLRFDRNNSTYTVATAGSRGAGRGGAVNLMHASEAAYYTNAKENLAAATQSVDEVKGVWGVLWREPADPLPFEQGVGVIEGWITPPSEIWVESTSAGNTGVFHEQYQDGMTGAGRYESVFVPWTLQPEYTADDAEDFEPSDDIIRYGDGYETTEKQYMTLNDLTLGQMKWRREKIEELRSLEKFKQEYPITVNEAFSAADIDDILIKPSVIMQARKRKPVEIDAPLIMGVDPASGGGDRFAVVIRKANNVVYYRARNDLNPKQSCDWIEHLIEEWKPSRVVIDNGNLGVAVVAFLREKSDYFAKLIRAVNFGGTSQAKINAPKKAGAVNRRAEMYDRLRTWLSDGGCVPDSDDFCTDLEANRVKNKDNNDWLLMSKKELKKMGIKSPDIGDALACTFAYREHFDNWQTKTTPEQQKNKQNNIFTTDIKFGNPINQIPDSPYSWQC